MRIQGIIFEDHRHIAHRRLHQIHDLAIKAYKTTIGKLYAGDGLEDRRLACPRRAKKHKKFPVLDVQINALERPDLAERFFYRL